jgi:hypothetical protein
MPLILIVLLLVFDVLRTVWLGLASWRYYTGKTSAGERWLLTISEALWGGFFWPLYWAIRAAIWLGDSCTRLMP